MSYETRIQMKTTKSAIALFGMLLFIVAGCGKSDTYTPETLSGVVWGTTYNITVPRNDKNIAQAVNQAISGVDSAANAFNQASEIAVLNREGRLDNASRHFMDILETAIKFNRITGGAFDPTVGPLVDLWGFGAGSSDGAHRPSQATVDSLRALTGIDKISISEPNSVTLRPGSRLDFAALAKGYGVDCVSHAIEGLGIENYMVEIGGELRVRGRNPHGQLWSVQIDTPIPDTLGRHSQLAVVRLADAAVATSGNYRNFFTDADGRMVSHTISPQTGCPVQTEILSATIFARDCMSADALATACMVLGLDKASELIDTLVSDAANGIYGAVFVTEDCDGNYLLNCVGIDNAHITL